MATDDPYGPEYEELYNDLADQDIPHDTIVHVLNSIVEAGYTAQDVNDLRDYIREGLDVEDARDMLMEILDETDIAVEDWWMILYPNH